MKRISFFFILFSSLLLAETDKYAQYLSEVWTASFSMVNSWIWILAIFPVVLFGYSMVLSHRYIKKTSSGQSASKVRGLDFTYILVYLKYGLSSLMSIFIIYGIFGMVYARSNSFFEVWEKLVVSFWSGLL